MIVFIPEWMSTLSLSTLFMVEAPSMPATKKQLLLYVPKRIQQLCREALGNGYKPHKLINEILHVPDHSLLSENSTLKEMQMVIQNTDQYASWETKFLFLEKLPNEVTNKEALEIYSGMTLFDYLETLSNT